MRQLANISVFESLQNQAHRSMGLVSDINVTNGLFGPPVSKSTLNNICHSILVSWHKTYQGPHGYRGPLKVEELSNLLVDAYKDALGSKKSKPEQVKKDFIYMIDTICGWYKDNDIIDSDDYDSYVKYLRSKVGNKAFDLVVEV